MHGAGEVLRDLLDPVDRLAGERRGGRCGLQTVAVATRRQCRHRAGLGDETSTERGRAGDTTQERHDAVAVGDRAVDVERSDADPVVGTGHSSRDGIAARASQ